MSYKIVVATDIDKLVALVNQYTKDGYEPVGGFKPMGGSSVAQTLFLKNTVNDGMSHLDIMLYNKLKNKRKELADAIAAPAYVVATNRMLDSLVSLKPKTKEELAGIYGFAEQKISLYGDIFLKIINE